MTACCVVRHPNASPAGVAEVHAGDGPTRTRTNFREEIEHVLSMAGLDVHECLADGTTVMRRKGIDPD
jgi:hypothetical protein